MRPAEHESLASAVVVLGHARRRRQAGAEQMIASVGHQQQAVGVGIGARVAGPADCSENPCRLALYSRRRSAPSARGGRRRTRCRRRRLFNSRDSPPNRRGSGRRSAGTPEGSALTRRQPAAPSEAESAPGVVVRKDDSINAGARLSPGADWSAAPEEKSAPKLVSLLPQAGGAGAGRERRKSRSSSATLDSTRKRSDAPSATLGARLLLRLILLLPGRRRRRGAGGVRCYLKSQAGASFNKLPLAWIFNALNVARWRRRRRTVQVAVHHRGLSGGHSDSIRIWQPGRSNVSSGEQLWHEAAGWGVYTGQVHIVEKLMYRNHSCGVVTRVAGAMEHVKIDLSDSVCPGPERFLTPLAIMADVCETQLDALRRMEIFRQPSLPPGLAVSVWQLVVPGLGAVRKYRYRRRVGRAPRLAHVLLATNISGRQSSRSWGHFLLTVNFGIGRWTGVCTPARCIVEKLMYRNHSCGVVTRVAGAMEHVKIDLSDSVCPGPERFLTPLAIMADVCETQLDALRRMEIFRQPLVIASWVDAMFSRSRWLLLTNIIERIFHLTLTLFFFDYTVSDHLVAACTNTSGVALPTGFKVTIAYSLAVSVWQLVVPGLGAVRKYRYRRRVGYPSASAGSFRLVMQWYFPHLSCGLLALTMLLLMVAPAAACDSLGMEQLQPLIGCLMLVHALFITLFVFIILVPIVFINFVTGVLSSVVSHSMDRGVEFSYVLKLNYAEHMETSYYWLHRLIDWAFGRKPRLIISLCLPLRLTCKTMQELSGSLSDRTELMQNESYAWCYSASARLRREGLVTTPIECKRFYIEYEKLACKNCKQDGAGPANEDPDAVLPAADSDCRDVAAIAQSSYTMATLDSLVEPREHWPHHMDFILSCVGYAVGFGSIWRFPYLCYKNGGGAFLIPYIVFMTICGVPLFFLELAIGQFSGASPLALWDICPLFKGVGWGMIIISGLVCIYYNIILTWVIYYLVLSFAARVPWDSCDNDFNTCNCTETRIEEHLRNLTEQLMPNFTWPANPRCNSSTPLHVNYSQTSSNEFWRYSVLKQSDGIDNLGSIHWGLLLSLIGAWLLIFACLCKGVKSVGKVVYVTATSPYLFLAILMVRNCMLPGSWEGIRFYITPVWSKLANLEIWHEAALQVFFALGPAWGGLITMSSFNKFKNNCYRDAIVVPIVNCLTSIFGGFVIFAVVGFMAHKTGKEVSDVVDKGPGLVFVAYPEAIAQMPVAPLWAILFFLMLITIGLDSQFGMFETMTSSFVDEFPRYLRKYKTPFVGLMCMVEFLLGLPLITQGGIYIFTIFDWFI
uniref:Transporter n=1 Tax=Macrostomum lignano TaxID=282301 RepID=A0A1I8IG25_9PLAT